MTACLREVPSCSLSPQAVLLVPAITIIQPSGKAAWGAESTENLYVCLHLCFFSGLTPWNGYPWVKMGLRASMERWWRNKSKPALFGGNCSSSLAVMWNSTCNNAWKFEVNTFIKSLWGRRGEKLHSWKNGYQRSLVLSGFFLPY